MRSSNRLSMLAALALAVTSRMSHERLLVIDNTRSRNGNRRTGAAQARRAAKKRRNVRARQSKRA